MKSSVLERANAYIGLNAIALKGEIVVYGSSYMANFPFYELINRCHLENAVYNRSIDGMTSEEADYYNGQQGDIWDAQKDMALAMLGSTIMLVYYLVKFKLQTKHLTNGF